MTKVVLTGFGPFGSVAVNPAHAGVLDAGMALYTDDGVQLVEPLREVPDRHPGVGVGRRHR